MRDSKCGRRCGSTLIRRLAFYRVHSVEVMDVSKAKLPRLCNVLVGPWTNCAVLTDPVNAPTGFTAGTYDPGEMCQTEILEQP